MECIDLFSGIGGISLALKPFVKTLLYCEVDPFCQHLLSERMENNLLEAAPIHGDIRTLHLSSLFAPKILCGGFPCQDISAMGLQKGIVDSDRSSLFFEILRIADETPSIDYIFCENVSNIAKVGMKEVVTELTKRGFNMQWLNKSAGSLGAPHVRNRWFCLASKAGNHDHLAALLAAHAESAEPASGLWLDEPPCRITFKPNTKQDSSYDTFWIQRCQTLGNTVVPAVVREAFIELAQGCLQWDAICKGLTPYCTELDKLAYPYPESGLVYKNKYLALPRRDHYIHHSVNITVPFDGKVVKLAHFPTPRRGITHASSLTARSLHDLPTILVYCEDSKAYIESQGVELAEKLHTGIIPNVNYIEWMMGYPVNWTRVTKYKKASQSIIAPAEPEETVIQEQTEPVSQERAPTTGSKKHPSYNGMHVLMKEMPGKGIKEVADAWRELTAEQRKSYSCRAAELV